MPMNSSISQSISNFYSGLRSCCHCQDQ